jgi:hypothetical protein
MASAYARQMTGLPAASPRRSPIRGRSGACHLTSSLTMTTLTAVLAAGGGLDAWTT